MNKLLKLIKVLMAKGFATSAEKAQVQALFKELAADEQETIKEDADKVADLGEKDPKEGEEEEALEKGIKTLVSKAVKEQTADGVAKAVEDIKAEVKAWIESQKESIAKAAGYYHQDVKKDRKAISDTLRKTAAALLGNDFVTLKELTTDGTGTPFGGYVVDRELSTEIMALVTEYGVARREFMTVPLSKNSYAANELVTDVTVNWIGEAQVMGSTEVVLGQEPLALKKLYAIVTLTRELLEDMEIDLFAFIGERVAEGFARKEDTAFFMGDGSGDTANGEYTGIMKVAGTNEVIIPVRGTKDGSAFSHATYDDVLAMQDKSPQEIARTGKYYGNRSVRNHYRLLKDSNGAPIYQDAVNGNSAMLAGKPFVEVEVMPTLADTDEDVAFLGFGNLKKSSIFGYRNGMAVDRFNAGTVRNVAGNADINLITTDREAVRWIERVGALNIMPSAFTVLKTSTGS